MIIVIGPDLKREQGVRILAGYRFIEIMVSLVYQESQKQQCYALQLRQDNHAVANNRRAWVISMVPSLWTMTSAEGVIGSAYVIGDLWLLPGRHL